MATPDELKQKIGTVEAQMQAADFWTNKSKAQEVVAEFNRLKDELEGGAGHDRGNAIMTVFAGAGGDDAEDFARILVEMYQRWAAKGHLDVILIHENKNDHGGYRNITFRIQGKGVYGILKGESGVHRLVRISPFNAKKLRHTSFALVEVIPEFKKGGEVEINPADLKIEFARSSGPGGQNVNKRETAVRVVHTPTGIAVHADGERSQERNREQALTILRGKIYKRQEEERESKEQGMCVSKTTEIEWGNQIRSYVLHPYKMVKDHRTGVETANIEGVLDGDIELFLK